MLAPGSVPENHQYACPSNIAAKAHLDHICRHESHSTTPVLRRVVENVVHVELAVLLDQTINLLSQQDILLIHIRKDEIDLRLVSLTPTSQDSANDLQHGSDTRASSNHAKAPHHVGRVHHRSLWSLDFHRVAHLQRAEMSADVAGWVGFDHQIEVAGVHIAGDGRIRPHDLFSLLDLAGLLVCDVEVGGERDVLADGQSEDAVGRGQVEPIDCCVV